MPTYPITLPTAGVFAENWHLMRVQNAMPSPFSGHFSAVDKYAQWVLTINLSRMAFADAEVWAAKLDSLRGHVGTFEYSPAQSQTSSLTSRTLGLELNKYANVARLGGWANDAASGLRIGQFMQIGNQLLRLTAAPAQADESGYCDVEFEPYARADYESASAVEFVAPKGLFRLGSVDQGGYSVDISRIPSLATILAVEVL